MKAPLELEQGALEHKNVGVPKQSPRLSGASCVDGGAMLPLPKVNKGIRGATSSLRRIGRVLAGAALAVGLLSAEPQRAVAARGPEGLEAIESTGAQSPGVGPGALLLTQHNQSPLLAGHRSHSSHRSHASHAYHASGYSPPEPKTDNSGAGSGSSQKSKDEQLRQLTALRDAGVITPEEFERLKKKLLAQK